MQLGRGRKPCEPGVQFGSRYPGDPSVEPVVDYLPDEQLRDLENIADFWGMLVFDKWTCNTNGRQAIFVPTAGAHHYRALMIDQGFCFNAGEWNFPDSPLRGIYLRSLVYTGVRGPESFAPWLDRLARQTTDAVLGEIAGEIPPGWYNFDQDPMEILLERLARRRERVPELLDGARNSSRQPFPNWT
jgi:hypothetical protein